MTLSSHKKSKRWIWTPPVEFTFTDGRGEWRVKHCSLFWTENKVFTCKTKNIIWYDLSECNQSLWANSSSVKHYFLNRDCGNKKTNFVMKESVKWKSCLQNLYQRIGSHWNNSPGRRKTNFRFIVFIGESSAIARNLKPPRHLGAHKLQET
jgi:hypothetical protein